jgi:hypothetical protein
MIEGLGSGAIDSEFDDRATVAPDGETGDGHGRDDFNRDDLGSDGSDRHGDGSLSDHKNEPAAALDDVARSLTAANSRTFFGSLVGALSSTATTAKSARRDVEAIFRLLGSALADGIDEETVFEEVVEAIDRQHWRSPEWVAVSAALLARIAAGPSLRTRSGPTADEAAGLFDAVTQIVRDALASGETRSWRLLPHLASMIARRNAQRNLPIATLAAALPRLWAQQAAGPHDIPTAEADRLQAGFPAAPQLMVLNGPVEIVILRR